MKLTKVRMTTAAGVYLLAPLPLAVFMGVAAWPIPGSFALLSLLQLFALAAATSLFVAGVRYAGVPIPDAGMKAPGALSVAGAVALYMAGSYYGMGALHLVGILGAYDGAVLFLGGKDLWGLVALPTLALLTVPAGTGDLGSTSVEVGLATVTVVAGVVAARARRPDRRQNCPDCQGYFTTPLGYCLRCGKRLHETVLAFEVKKVAALAVATMAIFGTSLFPVVALGAAPGPLQASSYTIAGVQAASPVVSPAGWNSSSRLTSAPAVQLATYNMSRGSENVTVYLASSTSRSGAKSYTSGLLPDLKENSTITLAGGESLQVLVPKGGGSIVALSWDGHSPVLNGTEVTDLSISFMAVETLQLKDLNSSGLYAISSSTVGRIQGTQQWNWFLGTVVGNWFTYSPYIGAGAAVFLLALPFEGARQVDMAKSKKAESSMTLTSAEETLLTFLASEPTPRTGDQCLVRLGTSGVTEWGPVEQALLRLESLGLVRHVVNAAEETLAWESLAL